MRERREKWKQEQKVQQKFSSCEEKNSPRLVSSTKNEKKKSSSLSAPTTTPTPTPLLFLFLFLLFLLLRHHNLPLRLDPFVEPSFQHVDFNSTGAPRDAGADEFVSRRHRPRLRAPRVGLRGESPSDVADGDDAIGGGGSLEDLDDLFDEVRVGFCGGFFVIF